MIGSFRRVSTPAIAEPAAATWSNCLVVGNEIVTSGVTARGRDGAPIGGASLEKQTLAVLKRVVEMVEAAGGGVQNIYKLVIYVTDIARKDEVNRARAAFFEGIYPCSTLLEVKGLVFPDLLVEIDAFANFSVDRHVRH
ncbi:Enamine deaminase RidA, house cleaning of reactive enamine intermediates, YjgF/YER057c/UK114 family [Enhydrobacter aerosaccus]|uniref:Enamine deaminase RidA, house cleaning of reactive enamine intermediates, YjgF/YER057c/UK114 family n=1 Tax=Enhydrobacter aerosaccus TaxID=225324 RepID=A0A1T4T3H5_9HYPH|nr:RidA family protein [Enhydrobacter aerosaccus]SKA35045.1 Enamine deaminase RidA, house cleaning of reactive enamine intermediates, YjgF/YER057c/UK114 family [Enhydrobacter aerosaccus]